MASIDGISGSTALAHADSAQAGTASPARRAVAAPVVVTAATPSKPDAGLFFADASHAPTKPASAEEVQKSAQKVQSQLASVAPNLTFTIDQETGRTLIKVVDPLTHEVLRQIPAEEILRLDRSIDQMIGRLKGLLIDRQG